MKISGQIGVNGINGSTISSGIDTIQFTNMDGENIQAQYHIT